MANYLNFKKDKYPATIEQVEVIDKGSMLAASLPVGPSLTSNPTTLGLILNKSSRGSIKPVMLDSGELGLIIKPYRHCSSSRAEKSTARQVFKTGHLEVWHNAKGIRISMTFPRTWSAEDIISKIDDEVFDLCHLYPEKLQYAEEKAPDNPQEQDGNV